MWIETQASVQSFFQKLNVDNSCQKNKQIQILHFIQILYYIILFRYFIKSCPILLYFFTLCLIFCLSKQIFIRNLSQSPSRLNVWTLSVTSKHFSNHDKNIMQVSCVKSSRFHHSHKKLHSLETCPLLLFMLLEDFFASARLHRVHKNFCCRKVQYITCVT